MDHVWSVIELRNAVDVIARAAEDHPDRLPRFHGARSGAVFARLVDEPVDDSTAPVTARLGKHLDRYDGLNKALKMYKPSLAPARREQIELFRVLLHETVAISTLSTAFLATFPPDDPSLPDRRHGIEVFYEGVAGMLFGSMMIADDRRVDEVDRIVVFGYLAEVAPALLPKISDKHQREIRAYADRLAAASTGALHDAAVRVQHAIRDPRAVP